MARKYREGDEVVPGFRLVRFLGQGAIGEVWHAAGPGGTEAAIKIVDLSGSGAHGLKEVRAMQLVKRIHHPNLTPIVGLWAKRDDGTLLGEEDTALLASQEVARPGAANTIVVPPEPAPRATELIIAMGLGQKSLAERLEECRAEGLPGMPPDELLAYLRDAARAIDFLNRPIHALATGTGAIVHCDIKPLNILVVGGAAQVCDFGLAHMVGAARKTAAAMGTIAYAAPELLDGKPSPTTDQYCLAITYYELRTGSLPYGEQSAFGVIEAVRKGELDFSLVSEAEQVVLRRATALDPAARYGSATEMVEALAAALGAPADAAARRPRSTALLRVQWAIAVVLLAAIGAMAYYLLPTLHRPEPQPGPGEIAQSTQPPLAKEGSTPATVEPPPDKKGPAENGMTAPDAGTTQPSLAQTEKLLQESQWDAARRELLNVVRAAPNNALARVQLGRACLGLDLLEEALEHLAAAVQAAPQDASARFYLGLALTKSNRFAEAVEAFEMATKLDADGHLGYHSRPEYAEAYLGVATRLAEEAKELIGRVAAAGDGGHRDKATELLKQAVAQLDRAIQHDPKRSLLWSRRGALRRYIPDFEGALTDISQAIALGGEALDKDLVFRGELRQRMAIRRETPAAKKTELLGQARQDFQEATKKNPHNADAHFFLAGVETLLADHEDAKSAYAAAVAAYSRAIETHPGWPDPWFTLAEAYYGRGTVQILTGQLREAAEDFTRVLDGKEPLPADRADVARTLHELAQEFWKARQPEEARRWNRRAIDLAPDQPARQRYQAVERSWQNP